MKVTVADIKVSYREEEVPDACPKCKRDFSVGENAVRAWEFQDQERSGFLNKETGKFKEVDKRGIPKGGEIFLEGLAFYCGACGELLVAGELEQRKNPPGEHNSEIELG